MDNKLPLSVAIITFNEAERLPKTLDSIKDLADEIVIIDSNSTDDTIDIAKSYGAKTYTQTWLGYAEQKNLALEKCSNDWILCLDADEVVTQELAEDINNAILEDDYYAFEVNRRTFYLGKLLKKAWQPDNRLRLVNISKSNAKWVGEFVHEELQVNTEIAVLDGELIHYSYKDITDHFEKTIKYAKLSAESYYVRRKKVSMFKAFGSAKFSFIKLYFLKMGFKDGMQGLIAAVSAFVYTFLKYAYLWDMYRNEKQ